MPFPRDDSSDDDSDYYDHDPGREVIEKNLRNRLQRIADYTKDELNKVLKRVDTVCSNQTFLNTYFQSFRLYIIMILLFNHH
jgi:hypothetical protein